MHTIASILLSVLGIYSPADVAGLPTHLYKNFTVQELALKLKGKNQEFCLTAFMSGRSLVRRACPTRDTSTTRGSTPCLALPYPRMRSRAGSR